MSKATRKSDVERTAAMLDLVHREYNAGAMSLSHVVLEEVAAGTGWAARRWADVLALSVWPSKGLTLDGYEIKASKQDLKKELSDPSKHEALARYCDTWTLVAWDEHMLVEGIPEAWGVQLTREGEFGRELYVHRRATKTTPEPWPRAFVCSLVRNAYEQAPGAAYVARAAVEANKRGRDEGRVIEKGNWTHAMRPLCIALFGPNEWKWPAEARDNTAVFRLAAERLTQLPLGETA